jgi:hypothetical protein
VEFFHFYSLLAMTDPNTTSAPAPTQETSGPEGDQFNRDGEELSVSNGL